MVPEAGFEPAWVYTQGILSPQRLPFRHSGRRLSHHSWNSDFRNPSQERDVANWRNGGLVGGRSLVETYILIVCILHINIL